MEKALYLVDGFEFDLNDIRQINFSEYVSLVRVAEVVSMK